MLFVPLWTPGRGRPWEGWVPASVGRGLTTFSHWRQWETSSVADSSRDDKILKVLIPARSPLQSSSRIQNTWNLSQREGGDAGYWLSYKRVKFPQVFLSRTHHLFYAWIYDIYIYIYGVYILRSIYLIKMTLRLCIAADIISYRMDSWHRYRQAAVTGCIRLEYSYSHSSCKAVAREKTALLLWIL